MIITNCNDPNIPEDVLKEYYTRFAAGEQYLQLEYNPSDYKSVKEAWEISEQSKDYYWQEQVVFNHLGAFVDKCSGVGEDVIFARNGLVARLLPLQRAYNAIKSRELEFINRLSVGVLCVEDGSVDTDELEEDGLAPGKVIVYRKGASAPSIEIPNNSVHDFISSEQRILEEMKLITDAFMTSVRVSGSYIVVPDKKIK